MSRWDVLRAAAHRGLGVACVALVLLAVGCGPLGDDDEEPTATPLAAGSPIAGSPAAGATPRGGPVQVTRPPTTASPTSESPDGGAESTPGRRPTRTPEPEETPAPPEETAEPTRDAERTPTPPSVEGCEEPEELPDVQGESDRVTSPDADEGVNLRAGPGADCDVLATLQPGTAVVVESGPVQSGDLLWVKITVEETEGWVAEQFLEPAEEEADE
jgi:hypothetical protein